MPTDHAHVTFRDVRVPASAIFGGEGQGLQVVQHFFNENRIRQSASSLGAAQYCIDQSVAYAKERKPFGRPLAANQAIQFPLVELQTQAEMVRALIHKTAWLMDTHGPFSASDKVSMCNYWANRLCCEAADRAMQVHGGLGYSRHKPFEHIYRHHRRYRITEGAEEIQMRRVAGVHVRLHAAARAQGRQRELMAATDVPVADLAVALEPVGGPGSHDRGPDQDVRRRVQGDLGVRCGRPRTAREPSSCCAGTRRAGQASRARWTGRRGPSASPPAPGWPFPGCCSPRPAPAWAPPGW